LATSGLIANRDLHALADAERWPAVIQLNEALDRWHVLEG
jgi:hypothetical protein